MIFMKKEIRTGITSQYSKTYSKEEECYIIYGVIQDVISKKLYEFDDSLAKSEITIKNIY